MSIFDEINKAKMREEEVGPAVSGQLAEVTHKYWADEAKKPAVVSKIMEELKIPSNCTVLRVPVLNEAVARNRRILPHICYDSCTKDDWWDTNGQYWI